MRWASLAPEATLWLTVAGLQRRIVARSHRCTEPSAIQRLPIATRANVSRTGWEAYLGPYAPVYGLLSTLRPEGILFLMESLPPDVSEEEILRLFQQAIGYQAQLFPLRAASWAEYEKLVVALMRLLRPARPLEKWWNEARRRLERLQKITQRITHHPMAIFIQPTQPLTLIQGWAAFLLETAGGKVASEAPRLSWEALLTLQPEAIILSLPASSLSEAGEALAQWVRLPFVQGLSAFRQKRLYAFKGISGIFYPSPLLISAAEATYELLHTPTYRYNLHLGRLWAPLL